MNKQLDVFAAKLSIAVLKHQREMAGKPSSANDLPLPGPQTLGGLRDMFKSVARADEQDPLCVLVGFDFTGSAPETFGSAARGDTPDCLALYADHLLLIRNPLRGAGTGRSLAVLSKSLVGRVAEVAQQTRIEAVRIRKIEVVHGRHGWQPGQRFLRVDTNDAEVWYWIHFPVVTEDELRDAVSTIGARVTRVEG